MIRGLRGAINGNGKENRGESVTAFKFRKSSLTLIPISREVRARYPAYAVIQLTKLHVPPFHSNTNCTSLKLDGNLWPESRMTLPLGGLPPREYPQEVPRSSRADPYGTIANFYCRRRTRKRGSRLRCTQGQVMTLGVTVTRRSPCSANTSTYIRTKVERRSSPLKEEKLGGSNIFLFSMKKKYIYIHRDIPSY